MNLTINSSGTSIEVITSNKNIYFYPIPFNNTLYVKYNLKSSPVFYVTDVLGKEYINGIINNNSISFEGMEKGIYFIHIEGKKYKVIKD